MLYFARLFYWAILLNQRAKGVCCGTSVTVMLV